MGLFEILNAFVIVGNNFKTNVYKIISIDDYFDRWNRGFMVFISVLFGTIVLFQHWIYDVINCLDFTYAPNNAEPPEWTANFQRFAEEYCWAYGLYTIREAYDLELTKTPFPGIIPEDMVTCQPRLLVDGGRIVCPNLEDVVPLRRIPLKWYPFVIFYFWIGAAVYFFPWRIYKLCGLRKVKEVVVMLQNRPQLADELPFYINRGAKWLDNTLTALIDCRNTTRGMFARHFYFGVVVSCKLVYLLISIGMLYSTNEMLTRQHQHGSSFINYGTQWIHGASHSVNKTTFTPIQNKLFPKMAACEVKRFGVTGLEEWNGMCVLAGNVFYQYLFLIYWGCLVVSIGINAIGMVVVLLGEASVGISYKKFLNSVYVEDTKELRLIYESIGTSGRVILRIIGCSVSPKVADELIKYMVLYMMSPMKSEGRSALYHKYKKIGYKPVRQ